MTDIKDSVKELKKDFEELKRSLEFSQKDLRDTDIKVTNLESKVEQIRMKAQDQEGFMDYVEDQMEHIENQSRRNNVKTLGLREDKEKETQWEETEKIVKNVIRNQLQIKEDIHIERTHIVGSHAPLAVMMTLVIMMMLIGQSLLFGNRRKKCFVVQDRRSTRISNYFLIFPKEH